VRRTRELVVATGRLEYEGKRFNTAKAMFEKAVRAYGIDPVSHYYLAKIALETGRDPGAVDRAIGHLNDATRAKVEIAGSNPAGVTTESSRLSEGYRDVRDSALEVRLHGTHVFEMAIDLGKPAENHLDVERGVPARRARQHKHPPHLVAHLQGQAVGLVGIHRD
jgi:hypothetical protein